MHTPPPPIKQLILATVFALQLRLPSGVSIIRYSVLALKCRNIFSFWRLLFLSSLKCKRMGPPLVSASFRSKSLPQAHLFRLFIQTSRTPLAVDGQLILFFFPGYDPPNTLHIMIIQCRILQAGIIGEFPKYQRDADRSKQDLSTWKGQEACLL